MSKDLEQINDPPFEEIEDDIALEVIKEVMTSK